ncbi:SWR1-complex protein 5 [Nannizzia gypsea CBS 118893]|uniref:SWR1-complex protein 5 n=1 Tax=Arthroderma gypseum (strain ATCC MYA-4604 / CBS 118893) TaxID=535722 RepID=E4V2F3_ARTGP|nr:SWR1-complex protein 5 [Nannizzia gypsea CBS 118893]EFR04218.1 SWR1-complex protein 5 [Nannizzia gypsea CBS 118893]
MARGSRISADGEAATVGTDAIPHEDPQAYNSEEDSDFDEQAAAQDAVESASEDEGEREDVDGERPRKKRRLSLELTGPDAGSDEEFAEPELESGDEAMIRHAKEKKENRRRQKAGGSGAANGTAGSDSDDIDIDDDDEGGEGGFVRTRRMRMQVQEEKKALAKTDGATIDVDSIWQQMNQPQAQTAADETKSSDADTGATKAQTASSKLPQEEMITIRRTYKFAGEMITEEKVVSKDSAEAKLYLSTLNAAKKKKAKGTEGEADTETDIDSKADSAGETKRPLRRPLRRFSRFDPNPPDAIKKSWEKHAAVEAPGEAENTAKGPKLNTVMKSKLDWAAYVDREGIKDDLDVHSKAKEGYMDRMDFLGRVDAKREEGRRNARLKNAGY